MTVKICVAGTFNRIHDGHLALLAKAFEIGDEIYIGLTSDKMALATRDVKVLDYASRMTNLREAAIPLSGGKPFRILAINDELGPAATGDYDGIVVSEATESNAVRINEARAGNGLRTLEITVIDLVLGEDGKPLSATGILKSQCNNP